MSASDTPKPPTTSKSKSKSKSKAEVAAPAEPAAPETPKRASAMKLPPGVGVQRSSGPQPRKPWESGPGGRPQRDAARRAGKSRKVH